MKELANSPRKAVLRVICRVGYSCTHKHDYLLKTTGIKIKFSPSIVAHVEC